jgi:hypothetical protein
MCTYNACTVLIRQVYAVQLQADPGVKDYEFEPIMRGLLGCTNPPPSTPGTSDSNPIILTDDVKIPQFIHLLEVVFGR